MTPIADRHLEIWFLTGSQDLYGEETLRQVAAQSQEIAERLAAPRVPATIVWKPVLTDADRSTRRCSRPTPTRDCVGVIAWMHTFSPAKMWIAGTGRAAQAAAAPPHPGRRRVAVVDDRHGLHEPQPGRAR